MTFNSEALRLIRILFKDSFYPKNIDRENGIGEWPRELRSVDVVIQDFFIYLRSIKRSEQEEIDRDLFKLEEELGFFNGQSRDRCEIKTYRDMMRIALSTINKLLQCNKDISTIVLRMDIIGETPKAKYCIYPARYKDVEEFELPEDGQNPFKDEAILPKNLNSIFSTLKAKKMFIAYITDYVKNNIDHIPPNTQIIVDGGVDQYLHKINPFIIRNSYQGTHGFLRESGEVTPDYLHTNNLGESDIGMFHWRSKLDKDVNVIISEDGDIMVVALLGCRRIYDPQFGFIKHMKTYVKKKNYIGRENLEGEELMLKMQQKQNGKNVRTTRSITEPQYVYIEQLYKQIINIDWWYGGKKNCSNPVEILCVIVFMCSNDFVSGILGVGFRKIWEVFSENSDILNNLVVVRTAKKRIHNERKGEKRKENTSDLLDEIITMEKSSKFGEDVYEYGIRRQTMEVFINLILLKAYPKIKKNGWEQNDLENTLRILPNTYPKIKTRIEEMNKLEALFVEKAKLKDMQNVDELKEVQKEIDKMKINKAGGIFSEKRIFEKMEDVYSYCATISWCLAYFGNGHIDGHYFAYSLAVDEDGNSKYGYGLLEKDEPAFAGNIWFSRNVAKKNIYWTY